MKKIKCDDEVIVIAGKDKGKRGKIVRVLQDGRVVVSGINMIKRSTKPNPMLGAPGGIVEKEAPIQASNVAIFNTATNKADRVGFKVLEDGAKVRVYKSNNEVIGS
ncbi:50S ribosomal protein L24 [Alkalimarinus sediminis]|uniref:Large ribosomal subunit protein uL24 n=1 Tax=Alkalimarinus sediminis TaxID=1632866 RepID=A0A9E8KQZ4_9ALTE|nr:50S ribosomal protein L24 [Alkalimarinus sediminis]UZW75412.1 50S ribosomal protein L24 [Alkalimarinus sediminis]